MKFVLALLLLTGTAHAELVDVAKVVPDAVLELHYGTEKCLLQKAVAERLAKAAAILKKQDRRLLIWDCYRSKETQEKLWKQMPDERFVANPKKGSVHQRGAAIDLSLVDQKMPTKFDEFSKAAYRATALKGNAEARRLDAAMTAAGFDGLATEWWHYDAHGL